MINYIQTADEHIYKICKSQNRKESITFTSYSQFEEFVYEHFSGVVFSEDRYFTDKKNRPHISFDFRHKKYPDFRMDFDSQYDTVFEVLRVFALIDLGFDIDEVFEADLKGGKLKGFWEEFLIDQIDEDCFGSTFGYFPQSYFGL